MGGSKLDANGGERTLFFLWYAVNASDTSPRYCRARSKVCQNDTLRRAAASDGRFRGTWRWSDSHRAEFRLTNSIACAKNG
jgi:hypothetical protein